MGCAYQLLAMAVALVGLLTLFTIIGPLICWPLALVLFLHGAKVARKKEG